MRCKTALVGVWDCIFVPQPDRIAGENIFACRPGGIVQLAEALSVLCAPFCLSGVVYEDWIGKALLEQGEKEGWDTAGMLRYAGATPTVILHAVDAAEADRPPAPDIPGPIPPLVYIDGASFKNTEQLCRQAKEAGSAVVLGWFGQKRPPEKPLLANVDILCMQKSDAKPESFLDSGIKGVFTFRKRKVTLHCPHMEPLSAEASVEDPFWGVAALLYRLMMEKEWTAGSWESLLRDAALCAQMPYEAVRELPGLLQDRGHEADSLLYAQSRMEGLAAAAAKSQWKPAYHISAPSGWINDPNGLIQINGVYHVFYQLHPFSAEWGPMYWGHATSVDLAHWHHEPIALAPDQPYEAGCFSGCAVNNDGVLTLLYTAHNDENAVKEVQCLAYGDAEGRVFTKAPGNPVIPAFPKDASPDFRDPKVWYQGGQWNMIVGTSKHKMGRVLLFRSKDLLTWTYAGIFCQGTKEQGHMWECPNYCNIDGHDILILSPIGMKEHKNVYFTGKYTEETGKFLPEACMELDMGGSFYAAQVFTDESGRSILFSWMDVWGSENPSKKDGWSGMLTLPRQLKIWDGRLVQQPVPELDKLHGRQLAHAVSPSAEQAAEQISRLHAREMEIRFTLLPANGDFSLRLSVSGENGGQGLQFCCENGNCAMFLTENKKSRRVGRGEQCSASGQPVCFQLFLDRSSLEVFVDDGALSFSQRFYPEGAEWNYQLSVSGAEIRDLDAWEMESAF